MSEARDRNGNRVMPNGDVLDFWGSKIDNIGTGGYDSARNSNLWFGETVSTPFTGPIKRTRGFWDVLFDRKDD